MNKVIIIVFSLLFMGCQQNVDPNLKVYGIEDFFDNVSISGGYFSTDEEKIIFSSNQSGIFNVYEANIQTGKINQLTASNKESFFVRAYVPNSNDFIYSADNEGNEIFSDKIGLLIARNISTEHKNSKFVIDVK